MTQPLKVITQTESWAQEVQTDLIKQLNHLLTLAHSGELQGLAYAGITIDDCTITGFSKNQNQAMLIGGLERVKFKMLSA